MRLRISFFSNDQILLPISYNHVLQGLIYQLMSPALRKFLHDRGFSYEKRKFKLFTFSRIFAPYRISDKNFLFQPPISFYLSSPKEKILISIAENLLRGTKFKLASNDIYLESIAVLPPVNFEQQVIIKMLSPLTVYSTLKKADGSAKTYYYSPKEEEFAYLVRENLRKKYTLIYGNDTSDFNFSITAYKVRPQDEKVILYPTANQKKPTVIKAWLGLYKIISRPEIIKLAYDCGLGAKNSQGFGCWEKYNKEKEVKNEREKKATTS